MGTSETLFLMVTAAVVAPLRAMEGDILAASNFLANSDAWTLQGTGWSQDGLMVIESCLVVLGTKSLFRFIF